MALKAGWPRHLLPFMYRRWQGDLVPGARGMMGWWLVSALLATAAFAQVDGGTDATSFVPDAGAAATGSTGTAGVGADADAGVAVLAVPRANCTPSGRVFSVSSIDANSNPVPAKVFVDTRLVGTTPQNVQLSSCDETAALVELESGTRRSFDLASSPERVVVNWDGRLNHWSLAASVDFTFFSPPLRLVPAGTPPAAAVVAPGLRFDRWGKYLHGTIGISVSPLLTPPLMSIIPLPVLPTLDLMLGPTWRPGSDTARLLVSVQAGLSQFVYPALRATVGGMFFERLVVTLALDGRLVLPRLVVPSFEPLMPLMAVGASTSIGVCL